MPVNEAEMVGVASKDISKSMLSEHEDDSVEVQQDQLFNKPRYQKALGQIRDKLRAHIDQSQNMLDEDSAQKEKNIIIDTLHKAYFQDAQSLKQLQDHLTHIKQRRLKEAKLRGMIDLKKHTKLLDKENKVVMT